MTGKFIVFEGVEGSGKSTQVAHLQGWLRETVGLDVLATRQPGGTALGVAIRRLLLEEEDCPLHDMPTARLRDMPTARLRDRAELMLYGADRAQHIEETIKPHLAKGGLVLCDRYTDSTIAYQGYGRGLDRVLIDNINFLATGGLESDLTIWLDVDVEIGLERAKKRGKFDRMEKTELSFHRRVQQGYEDLAATFPDRILRLDASGDEAAQQLEIRSIVGAYLERSGLLAMATY